MSDDVKIAIILGSTRPGRKGEEVARWVAEHARGRQGATYELVDLADFDLVLLDDPVVPGAAKRDYQSPKTRAWSQTIDEYDAYVFVTAEYNHGVPAALKNAVDVLYPEWNDKALGLVSYGADGGVRAVEQWRVIGANLRLVDVRAQVSLSTFFDWQDGELSPLERRPRELANLFGQLEAMAAALRPLRA